MHHAVFAEGTLSCLELRLDETDKLAVWLQYRGDLRNQVGLRDKGNVGDGEVTFALGHRQRQISGVELLNAGDTLVGAKALVRSFARWSARVRRHGARGQAGRCPNPPPLPARHRFARGNR